MFYAGSRTLASNAWLNWMLPPVEIMLDKNVATIFQRHVTQIVAVQRGLTGIQASPDVLQVPLRPREESTVGRQARRRGRWGGIRANLLN
ncbi:hypothetical protein D3227_35280 [Mesorhizobium waimense]|uniref:Uncharacterized protein n=1 Tax=Mesorhizobium waimense TaxID=1300307 RepID=A0A3A5JXY3_9HYPH|nr:hypothetical protein D3227_35280 [Mesorhizobium waimense]